MRKIKLAVCIMDEIYKERLTFALLKYYRNEIELHVFSEMDKLLADNAEQMDAVLCDVKEEILEKIGPKLDEPVLVLQENARESDMGEKSLIEREGTLRFIDKYQNINGIVDSILKEIGTEICKLAKEEESTGNTEFMGIYSLAENEYQLPFVVTLASIIGEKSKVLILDMQENSGLSKLAKEKPNYGLEEILAMAESGHYATGRIRSAIAHMDKADFVYPAENTECICEMGVRTYQKLLSMLKKELDYDVILINFGSRFVGFFDILNECKTVYLMARSSGLCQWREHEFAEELDRRGYQSLRQRIRKVELPAIHGPVTTCERLVEQWKWNEFGDSIRQMMPMEASIG